MDGVHGGVKFYRGSPAAARSYVESDRSRVDDYYLAEGTGVARHYSGARGDGVPVQRLADLDGATYEQWVAGHDTAAGQPKGRLRQDDRALRFVEVVVNGPKTWSLAAALHPAIATAYDNAQERAALEIIGWLAQHTTTRVGPRGRQVQIPTDQIEATVIRHHTSRAGDPHRHLHLQINARVLAGGRWRGLHSVGVVEAINAINGIGHAAVMCDPEFRQALADHGYHLDHDTGDVTALTPYAGAFAARAAQIARNTDRYEAAWRRDHPLEEPGPRLLRSWDRRAWADARPDKVTPHDGTSLTARWVDELHDLGYRAPTAPVVAVGGLRIGQLDRDAAAELIISRLGARRSSWNHADIRGEAETIIAGAGVVAATAARRELSEDLTARSIARCARLLDRDDTPDHIRALTSTRVLRVENDLLVRLARRAGPQTPPFNIDHPVPTHELDEAQHKVARALIGEHRLLVIEGAAGAGKTTALAAARDVLADDGHRLMVVTPTLKAAHVAAEQIDTEAHSAGWLIHRHGFRWDDDGHWTREDATDPSARLTPGDLLLVDEAGMLDQDTALAILAIADESGARVALVGDRHQLPAVGRGGVLDLAARWVSPEAHLTLDTIHRFSDPEYAELSTLMRTGRQPGAVFDALLSRGDITIHATDVERVDALADVDGLVIADTRQQVAVLNGAIRDRRRDDASPELATGAGELIGPGDLITTRRNDPRLDVANHDTWTVRAIGTDGSLVARGPRGARTLPPEYVHDHVELAYATTAYGAQGQTVPTAHLALGESTGAASAYVGMTRGRHRNVAHIVADSVEDARTQWIQTFSRDRADLGPRHAAWLAEEDIERYGPQIRRPTEPIRLSTPARRPARSR